MDNDPLVRACLGKIAELEASVEALERGGANAIAIETEKRELAEAIVDLELARLEARSEKA